MRKIKIISSYLIIILLMSSCHFHRGEFIITNNSDFDIDSLTITPDSKKQYASLKKGEKVVYYTSLDKANSDGSYVVSFLNAENKKLITKKFGYYSSGIQIEDSIMISILNDNIVFESKFDDSITNKYK